MIQSVQTNEGNTMFVFEDTLNRISENGSESIKMIKQEGRNNRKQTNGINGNTIPNPYLSLLNEYHHEKLPFPPLSPDYTINQLMHVKSDILTLKKVKFVENKQLNLKCGLYYRGSLKYGKMDGKGKLYLMNVDLTDGTEKEENKYLLYEGDFKDNKVNGHGTLYFAGKEKFIGEFKNGVAHGIGKYYIRPDRILNEGIWVEGIFKN